MRILLPNRHWFVSLHEGQIVTNTYSGSFGTVSDKGGLSTRTFNYRVYARFSESKPKGGILIAESFVIQPWSCGGRKTDNERAEFECSDNGIKEAGMWLAYVSEKCGF